MRELFVYYRVPSMHAATAEAAVTAMQQRLRAACPGLIARLLRRPAAEDGLQTWMETYAAEPGAAPEGVGPRWQATIEAEALALAALLAGPRHTEVFVSCGD